MACHCKPRKSVNMKGFKKQNIYDYLFSST